jgi:hypothetical protein
VSILNDISPILNVIHGDFLNKSYARLDRREMWKGFKTKIANCHDSFEMNRALSGIYLDQS